MPRFDLVARAVTGAVMLTVCTVQSSNSTPDTKAVIETYANIALAGYEDSLITARALKAQIDALLADPSETTLAAAKDAWLAARVPYQQTEVFRFGNKIVDDWEGKVNAWPLDEGLIDYVEGPYAEIASENTLYAANVIANPSLRISGQQVDASQITKGLLSDVLQEADGVEANVATGYHAIEFLLWGQDLNGTDAGAGARPASDYDTANCTNGNCDRRAAYLLAATELLIDDLEWITAQWKEGGQARATLMNGGENDALVAIFTGLGSLSYGELAGERMKLGLLLHDPEEEHDCFSDNTHNSHYYNVLGIQNVYLGRYKRVDGTMVSGPGVSDLVEAKAPEIDERVKAAVSMTVEAMNEIVERAEGGEAYDQMIGEGNDTGNELIDAAIRSLIAQAKEFERAISALQLQAVQFEGSDSLDNPATVLQ